MNTATPYNVLYYGQWGQPGHYLLDEYGRTVRMAVQKSLLPWTEGQYYSLPPGFRRSGYDIIEAPQGHASLHRKGGWTALAFWDRSGDHRGNSMSCFFVRGEHTFDEVVQITKERLPSLWKRFPFEVICKEDQGILNPDHLSLEEKAADYARVTDMLRQVIEDRDKWRQRAKDLEADLKHAEKCRT